MAEFFVGGLPGSDQNSLRTNQTFDTAPPIKDECVAWPKLECISQKGSIRALSLVVAALLIYGASLSGNFLSSWDDGPYVVLNQAAHGFSLPNIRAAFSSYFVGNYAPLQIISYMLDYSIFGLDSFGYRLDNLILHCANCLLFYLFAKKLENRSGTAFLAALIFLCHPVQVETVAWISQRKNLLALFFSLAAVILYSHYRTKENYRRWYYIAALLSFVCALLSKSVAVIIPLVLIAYDICVKQERVTLRMFFDKIPFLACAVIGAVVNMYAQSAGYGGGGRTGYHGGSFFATMISMFPVYIDYLRMIIWPVGLSAYYDVPIRTSMDQTTIISAGGLLILAGCWVSAFKRRPHLFFWGALFILGLLPVSQIVPIVTLKNDRYLYFPMLGASAILSCGATTLYERFYGKVRTLWGALVFGIIIVMAIVSQQRSKVWGNHLTLWQDAASKNPGSGYVWEGLAEAYHLDSRYEEANQAYFRVLSIGENVKTLNNLAILYRNMGNQALSVQISGRVVQSYPDFLPGYTTLGKTYLLAGNHDQAAAVFRQLETVKGGRSNALLGLASVDLVQGRLALAESRLKEAMSLGASRYDVYYGMASLESIRNNTTRSLDFLEKSFQEGFLDYDTVSTDPNLQNTRSDSRFRALEKKYFRK